VAGLSSLRTVILVIGTLLMLVAAYLAGTWLSGYEGTSYSGSRGAFLVAGAPGLALMVYVLLLALNVVWKVRVDGTRLRGIGVAGPTAIDLAELTSVREQSSRQGMSLELRDGRRAVRSSVKSLQQGGVLGPLADAVRHRQAQGGIAVSRGAAALLRVPQSDGAVRGGGRATLFAIAVVILFIAAVIVGLSVG
jgi:hypothetical protein